MTAEAKGKEVHAGSRNPMAKSLWYLCLQATLEGQGSYAHVHEIAKRLVNFGWDVRLFEPEVPSRMQRIGPMRRILGIVSAQWSLLRALCRQKPDVMYIRWHFAALPAAIVARIAGVPVIQEVNGTYSDLFIAWPVTRWLAPLFVAMQWTQLRLADGLIATSEQLADWVRKESRNRNVRSIPIGVDLARFHSDAVRSERYAITEQYVLYFGALARWQGIATMLRAASEPTWPSGVMLVVAGDGVERWRVEEALHAPGGNVRYVGLIPYNDIPGLVAKSFATLSPVENTDGYAIKGPLSLKFFESLSCGVPVIVSDFPGMADLVREANCGFVVEPEAPAALAEAVAYLFSNPEQARLMGKAGRDLVERGHSWESRVHRTDQFIRTVVACRKRY
jgi:glycosyltransferase involved in cell wall biosynthesis